MLDGVRVDHPDGLRDPLEYLRRLRQHAPEAWIVGEKILEPGEFLRERWPIQGTTGYDFLNVAASVLVWPQGMAELSTVYQSFLGKDYAASAEEFHAIAHEKKIDRDAGGAGQRRQSVDVDVCGDMRGNRDRGTIHSTEVTPRDPRDGGMFSRSIAPMWCRTREEITDEDREYISQATECAKQKRLDIDADLFDFLRDVLTMVVTGKQESEFLLRFQQFTGPVMAKGVEDTAFYCYNRLTGMNEVGSDPGRNGVSVAEFHAYCEKMQATHPLTMTDAVDARYQAQ